MKPLTWDLRSIRNFAPANFTVGFLGIMLLFAPIVNWENAYRARYYLGWAPVPKKV
jgi:hypothetical protein